MSETLGNVVSSVVMHIICLTHLERLLSYICMALVNLDVTRKGIIPYESLVVRPMQHGPCYLENAQTLRVSVAKNPAFWSCAEIEDDFGPSWARMKSSLGEVGVL